MSKELSEAEKRQQLAKLMSEFKTAMLVTHTEDGNALARTTRSVRHGEHRDGAPRGGVRAASGARTAGAGPASRPAGASARSGSGATVTQGRRALPDLVPGRLRGFRQFELRDDGLYPLVHTEFGPWDGPLERASCGGGRRPCRPGR